MGQATAGEIRGHCWHCRTGLTGLDYGRESRCPGCDKPNHCCRNCRHFAPGRASECMEPQAERVIDKTRSNFCDWFEPARDPDSGAGAPDADALRSLAEALFRPGK